MRLYVVAGESSGDLHAARVLQALRARIPDLELRGIGGERMIEQGLHSIVPQSQMSVVGFAEVAKRYTFFKRTLRNCVNDMREWKADAVLTVDYPGFNTRLAEQAKAAGIPVIWYIAPQFWAWGASRAKSFARVVDHLLVVFPFEVDFFKLYGIDAEFVGHPLLDDPVFAHSMLAPSQREKSVAFLPGSRRQEIHRHLPLFREVALRLKAEFPDHTMVLAKAASLHREVFDTMIADKDLFRYESDSRKVMQEARAGLIKTGTSTLEASLCGLPHCMVYKTSGLSYAIARRLVRLPYISLTNILAQRMLVREFIQSEADPIAISNELSRLLRAPNHADELYEECLRLRSVLGDAGAATRSADAIIRIVRSQALPS